MVTQTNGTTNHTATELEGRVVRTNDRGILLEGSPSWLNVSKFAGDVDLPAVGQVVRLTLDRGGYIRAIEPVEVAAPEPRRIHAVDAQETASEPPSKDTTITRLACLKAAATVCTYRGEVVAADVLQLATAFEQWVLR